MAASWCLARNFYLSYGLKLYKQHPACPFASIQCARLCSTLEPVKPPEHDATDTQYTITTKPGEKKDTSLELPPKYSPQYVEEGWYDWWVEQGLFKPKASADGQEKFVLCLPPPNVTGTLHLGHALTCAIQDAVVRWNRMHGRETVWVPGCDHAGIATQVIVEKQLLKHEKKTRHDIGREEFLNRVWDWKNKKGDRIYNQMRKMGASLDWSRSCFTMDESMSEAVREAFIRLHDEGLIYRNSRLVHWCCHLRSTISDIEVMNQEIDSPTRLKIPGYDKPVTFGEITSFAYPVVHSDEEIVVATTRLETMLGDTAVAVHPLDSRYTHLHGSHVQHPFDGRHIPIIIDESVNREFGTGAVKITPAHDHNDYAMGVRHNLQFINVIDDQGALENVPEPYRGMRRFDARVKVARELQRMGLYRDKKPHSMVLPLCQRSNDVIEPLVKEQWYVKCAEMATHARQAVASGELKLEPDYNRKIWNEFMSDEKSRDWCISRQIWWGHRIPAYQVIPNKPQADSTEVWVSAHSEADAYLRAEETTGLSRKDFTLKQDEDVLDTWFSSALFPFSVFGWPKQTEDLSRFYPNSLLETGSDILFFWVARMIMLGYKMTGHLPFSKVLLHGTLRDAKGRKMSKSLGNVIDPMDVIYGISLQDLNKQVEQLGVDEKEVKTVQQDQEKDFPNGIEECGTDALRFALCSYQFKDAEIRMNLTHVLSYKHFCNKIWQAFRFVQQTLGPDFEPSDDVMNGDFHVQHPVDQWLLSRLSSLVQDIDEHFVSYDLQFVTQALYAFLWNDLCAVYLEYSKKVQPDDNNSNDVKNTLYLSTHTFLRALSPFMPYLSEELYQRLGTGKDGLVHSVCVAEYPKPVKYGWYNADIEADMELVKSVCSGTMSMIKMFELSPKTLNVYVQLTNQAPGKLDAFEKIFSSQLRTQSTTLLYGDSPPTGCLQKTISADVNVFVQPQDLSKISSQLAKLEQAKKSALEKLEKLEAKNMKKRSNVQDKIEAIQTKVTNIEEQMAMLKSLSS